MGNPNKYVPALRFHWLTRIYDPLVALTTRESTFKEELVNEAEGAHPTVILDLACGTGTLSCLLKKRLPDSRVCALDADPEILELAERKALKEQLKIEFNQGMSFDMPFDDNSFGLVTSSLFFHHLNLENKRRTLTEVSRILKPDGRLVICDWGRPSNIFLKASFNLVRMLDGFEVTRHNYEGQLPAIIDEAGFRNVIRTKSINAPLGTLDLITAERA
ncbi:class I SAM-dependent methyltransferase [Elongatibacter sediminis]|uniref:Class I SAM-dependent methyltransferase n=1 Tax=Elongatibacter sediminis TaxID=3119006 RepID=A0AAW9RIM8_9GAMM